MSIFTIRDQAPTAKGRAWSLAAWCREPTPWVYSLSVVECQHQFAGFAPARFLIRRQSNGCQSRRRTRGTAARPDVNGGDSSAAHAAYLPVRTPVVSWAGGKRKA